MKFNPFDPSSPAPGQRVFINSPEGQAFGRFLGADKNHPGAYAVALDNDDIVLVPFSFLEYSGPTLQVQNEG
jgi:hypothetical protein